MKKVLILLSLLSFSCSKKTDEIDKKDIIPSQKQIDIASIDVLVSDFMTKYNLPGASLAITKNEKLVYTKGYGLANVETKELVTPKHVFRIGSCTKSYTGMAIMKLVQVGALKLTDKVFGSGAILGSDYGKRTYSNELKQITVGHLLHNTSGAFVGTSGQDLINSNEQLNNKDYMHWLLDNTNQEFTPGSKYHYVNVNYFVASMIIEKVAGESYESFLRELVLKPIQDYDTRLGKIQPFSNEVKYYGQGVLKGLEYGTFMNRYFGAGAMLGNAESLLRFATAIDGKNQRPDILSVSLMKEYKTVSTLNTYQAHGVGVWGERYFFYGSIPGTRSGWILDKSTGLAAAIVFNGNLDYTKADYDTFAFAMQDMIVDLVTKQRNYQDIDQFFESIIGL